jgi:hypothetical protein
MADDEDEEDAGPPGLPPGTPFYMTPAGVQALRAELKRLWEEERAALQAQLRALEDGADGAGAAAGGGKSGGAPVATGATMKSISSARIP